MNFRKVLFSTTIESVRCAVERNGGVLASYGFGFATPTAPTEHPDGWNIVLCDRQGMGNHGTYVAVANSWENYDFQESCTLRILRRLADDAEKAGDWREDESLDIGTMLVPILMSNFRPSRPGRRLSIGQDGKWVYYAHSNGNYLRIGDDTDRLWVRRQRIRLGTRALKGGLSDRQCRQQLLTTN